MRRGATLSGADPQEARFNYFLGNDPRKWRTNLPTYGGVLYRDAYPGIDLKFYGTGRQLEYDLIVQPGADFRQVKFQYEGVRSLQVNPEGDLVLELPDGGQLVQKKPVVYQEIAGRRLAREGRFQVARAQGKWRYGFQVAAYDKSRPLIIDPVLLYSTYLGGSKTDTAWGIAVDRQGCAYVTGDTSSTDFPTKDPYYPANPGGQSVFVSKFNAAGNGLYYSTYLGGSASDHGYGIGVDGEGNAYVSGSTQSSDFPTKNAFQTYYGGSTDCFVAKFGPDGTLAFSTFLGGSSAEEAGTGGIVVDGAGNVYVTGLTGSGNFPITNAYQAQLKGWADAFVTKVAPTGALLYSTYLGGSSEDRGYGIALDAAGRFYVAGSTSSTDFPVVNPFQGSKQGITNNGFVAKFQSDGQALVYSTYLGGTNGNWAGSVGVDAVGNIYVTGWTESTDFPVKNAFQATYGGNGDAFVAKLNPALAGANQLLYSTYLGGGGTEFPHGLAADSQGNAHICGWTGSTDFPEVNPLKLTYLLYSGKAFVAKFSPNGVPFFSFRLGGPGYAYDYGNGLAVDRNGNIYLAGQTNSDNFPLKNPYQATYMGAYDGFVAKISPLASITGMEWFQLLLDED
jgi:hypothetical protein